MIDRQDTEACGPLHLRGDGLRLAAPDYARLLARLAHERPGARDDYLHGGAVAELEKRFACELGKEAALYLPSGGLANHLALRALAALRRRVLVPAESHLYHDEHDGAQTLSGLNLIPVGFGQGTVPLGAFQSVLEHGATSPHPMPFGAISLENPLRRRHGELFALEEMQRISAFARAQDLALHLDGARLFIASAVTGIAPADYAALFDTVYVSLYKCFNAPSGAVVAGPRPVIDRIAADRKIFGADLFQAWPDALVALHFLDGFCPRFRAAMTHAQALFARLNAHPRFRVEALPAGTNVFKLHVTGVEPDAYAAALARAGLAVRVQDAGERFPGVWLLVNESLNTVPPERVAELFLDALAG